MLRNSDCKRARQRDKQRNTDIEAQRERQRERQVFCVVERKLAWIGLV